MVEVIRNSEVQWLKPKLKAGHQIGEFWASRNPESKEQVSEMGSRAVPVFKNLEGEGDREFTKHQFGKYMEGINKEAERILKAPIQPAAQPQKFSGFFSRAPITKA